MDCFTIYQIRGVLNLLFCVLRSGNRRHFLAARRIQLQCHEKQNHRLRSPG